MKKLTFFLMMVCFLIGIGGGFLLHLDSIDTADEQVDQLADAYYSVPLPEANVPDDSLSEQEIVTQYQSSYSSLMAEADHRIRQLASEAQNEYMNKVQNQEDVSYSYFFSKYNSAANRLEESTDQAFATIHKQMKNQLQSQGYSSQPAQEMKSDYEQTKKQWRSDLLQEVKAAF